MAWRLDEVVEHGIIDNTVAGMTTGKVWLKDRDEPLILSLDGDCWRDIAGAVLEFENPSPVSEQDISDLDTDQTGVVGDITASKKVRIPEFSEKDQAEQTGNEKEIPFTWQNSLYIEWFSESNGRMLLEVVGFKVKISEHFWNMDEDEEEAQKLANLSAMRDFLSCVIRRPEPKKGKNGALKVSPEMDEYEWEERLKESDRLSDAYQEVLEKYMEDTDAERKEAFVMGWDGLLGAMAERQEGGIDEDDDDDYDDEDDEDFWSDDEDEGEDSSSSMPEEHPLQQKAHELALRASDLLSFDGKQNFAAERLVSQLIQVSSKLASVLSAEGSDYEPERGFVLAVLKRCLNYINDAIGSSAELSENAAVKGDQEFLEKLRADIFEVRDGILQIRRQLKQS